MHCKKKTQITLAFIISFDLLEKHNWDYFPLVHYGQFRENLSQNWGMNFWSCGFIFILFLKVLTSKAQKNCRSCTKFWNFGNWNKITPAGAKFRAIVLGRDSSKPAIVQERALKIDIGTRCEGWNSYCIGLNATPGFYFPIWVFWRGFIQIWPTWGCNWYGVLLINRTKWEYIKSISFYQKLFPEGVIF